MSESLEKGQNVTKMVISKTTVVEMDEETSEEPEEEINLDDPLLDELIEFFDLENVSPLDDYEVIVKDDSTNLVVERNDADLEEFLTVAPKSEVEAIATIGNDPPFEETTTSNIIANSTEFELEIDDSDIFEEFIDDIDIVVVPGIVEIDADTETEESATESTDPIIPEIVVVSDHNNNQDQGSPPRISTPLKRGRQNTDQDFDQFEKFMLNDGDDDVDNELKVVTSTNDLMDANENNLLSSISIYDDSEYDDPLVAEVTTTQNDVVYDIQDDSSTNGFNDDWGVSDDLDYDIESDTTETALTNINANDHDDTKDCDLTQPLEEIEEKIDQVDSKVDNLDFLLNKMDTKIQELLLKYEKFQAQNSQPRVAPLYRRNAIRNNNLKRPSRKPGKRRRFRKNFP